ncbi:putative MAPEG superfamily protein [Rhizobium sp. BK275]|uniref:hypothetical protein n=1 Tax=Rhizobium sp. BK275 TaxID=2587077 RepID=UPI00160B65A9|nr:hypothetical protein [Rhizobium sp. BK275]MBB3389215.1 putative MAPEG superfamily protein [Rhizobium sp. BK275]
MILAIGTLIVMGILAAYANRTVAPNVAKLPMQWSLKGKVNWTAPRAIAFAFIPVLAAVVLVAILLGDRARNTNIALMSGIFLACQLLHITLTQRWFTTSRR